MAQPDLYEQLVEATKLDPHNTPVDQLMNAPYGTHACTAFAMEYDETDHGQDT